MQTQTPLPKRPASTDRGLSPTTQRARTVHNVQFEPFMVRVRRYPWFCRGWSFISRPEGRGPEGLRPTRAYAPTWTCTVAEIARLIRPSPIGLRFYSSLRVQAPRRTEVAFPIVGFHRPGLRPAPSIRRLRALQTSPEGDSGFTGSGARKFLTTACGYRRPRRASPDLQRDHLPNSHKG